MSDQEFKAITIALTNDKKTISIYEGVLPSGVPILTWTDDADFVKPTYFAFFSKDNK